jgi:hypothetical protein
MVVLRVSGSLLLLALAVSACGRQSKDNGKKDQEQQTEEGAGIEALAETSPMTPEETSSVVVDESGVTVPIVKVPAAVEPAVTFGKAPCSSSACFKIGQWSLNFGQTYVQFLKDGKVTTQIMDGFENSSLSQLQAVCLLETANALREYAAQNTLEMQSFADAGVNTSFAARVYDTTHNKNKVLPNLYFIKGSDGVQGGVSLSRGKWVIRSAITGDKSKEDCQILQPEQIKERLMFWKGELLSK